MSQDFKADETKAVKKESCPECHSDLHEMISGVWRCVWCLYREKESTKDEEKMCTICKGKMVEISPGKWRCVLCCGEKVVQE